MLLIYISIWMNYWFEKHFTKDQSTLPHFHEALFNSLGMIKDNRLHMSGYLRTRVTNVEYSSPVSIDQFDRFKYTVPIRCQ